jgi:hypothetical protein
MRDRGPYPVLALMGEQGSAKSSFATILRSLVDPNTAALRSFPREDRDLLNARTWPRQRVVRPNCMAGRPSTDGLVARLGT